MTKNTAKTVSIMAVLLLALVFVVYNASIKISAETVAQKEARLKQELLKLEQEIRTQETVLKIQQQETGSLTKDVNVLQEDIKKKKLEIQQKSLLIQTLQDDIGNKTRTISILDKELNREKASLARVLRRSNEIEDFSFLELLLSDESVSDFYQDIDAFGNIQGSLHDSFGRIKSIQFEKSLEKADLEKKKVSETNYKSDLEIKKQDIEKAEVEKKNLLEVSKFKEKRYEDIITERKAEAAKIRAALFELRDLRNNQQGISFGEAVQLAQEAEKVTGVRAAYILGVLKQESNLGKNVGTCNRVGDSRTWRDIMPGPTDNSWRDDQTAFLKITKELGIDPEGQPLSCPLASGGWGGAMGPSQFIPTTWLSYQDRIAQSVGVSVPNPWIPRHAIMATALYMKDLGASAQTFNSEREAACRYYSGRGCFDPYVQNLFYGNAVMEHATQIAADIKTISEN